MAVVGVEDVEEAFGVGEGLVHLVVDAVELPDGRRHVVEQQNVEHDGPNGNLPIEHQVGRQDDDEHHANLLDEGFEAVVEEVGFAGFQLGGHEVVLHAGLLLALVVFAHEALDDHNGVDDVDEALALLLAQAAQAAAHAVELVGLPVADPEVDRQDAPAPPAPRTRWP